MTVTIEHDGRSALFMRNLRAGIKRNTPRTALRAGRIIVDHIGKEIDKWAKNPTGALARSFDVSVRRSSRGITNMSIRSDKVYAAIHETGGVIRPVKARALTIPLTPAARLLPAKQWGGRLFRPRGKSILATKGGAGGGITPQFALKQSVTIRPKRYISKAARASLSRVERLFGEMVIAVSKRAAR